MPKARILEAVREAKGEASAQLIDHLKKPDMAKEAERLLAGSGWLPEPLARAAGVVVRFVDANNCYVARASAIEHNVSFQPRVRR